MPRSFIVPVRLFLILTLLQAVACDDEKKSEATCGDGTCASGENPGNCAVDCPVTCGDGWCTAPAETRESCAADCLVACGTATDLSPNIASGELFYGYPALGMDADSPSCGSFASGREVYVSFTPDFTGELVISTLHPATNTTTIIEVREDTCDGSPVGCIASASGGTALTVQVQALRAYVVMVETGGGDAAGGEDDVFALSLSHRGVCDGLGTVTDLTSRLLTGQTFALDTTGGAGSVAGTCGGGAAAEARVTFVAPVTAEWIATTAHPATTFDTLLHLREGGTDGASFCASSEAEIACDDGAGPFAPASWMRFDAIDGLFYDLFVDGADTASGAATLTVGLAADSPATADLLGCSHTGFIDRYAFFAPAGAEVLLATDTVDAQTAADLRLRVRAPDGTELHEADDDFDCTFPPPQWSCPSYTFSAASGGLYTVEIYVGTSEACADRTRVRYELTTTVGGAPAEMILFGDQ
ncbi:MAG: hypothetical protein CVU65_00395 [Deltaproteobacteria bacterium HGW-Deltaproteobacteria-22]|jgi:hypothetical protein|nr:MAG: hypothetical protein CVU65_00395 [Deltaproteobacteria bacterium HGW-Deltaproteobacteria-22]